MKKIKLNLMGMSCASCANTVDLYLEKTEGVEEVKVNLMNEKAYITYDENKTNVDALIKSVRDAGYDASLVEDKEEISFLVEGMTCANCAHTVETSLKKLKGIESVSVNVATDKAFVTYDKDHIKISEMKKTVSDAGYQLILDDEVSEEDD